MASDAWSFGDCEIAARLMQGGSRRPAGVVALLFAESARQLPARLPDIRRRDPPDGVCRRLPRRGERRVDTDVPAVRLALFADETGKNVDRPGQGGSS